MTEFLFEWLSSVNSDDVEDINKLLALLPLPGSNRVIRVQDDYAAIVAQKSFLCVARDPHKQRIIGMTCLIPCFAFASKSGQIEDVVVVEQWRRQGIATKLMLMLLWKAEALNLEYIVLHSNPKREAANEMYLRFKFELIVKGDAEKGTSNWYRINLPRKL